MWSWKLTLQKLMASICWKIIKDCHPKEKNKMIKPIKAWQWFLSQKRNNTITTLLNFLSTLLLTYLIWAYKAHELLNTFPIQMSNPNNLML